MAAPPITPLPTPPSTSDPANFDMRGDTFLGSLPGFVLEANALYDYLNLHLSAAAAPGGVMMQYVFDTTTTAADPGSGKVRLNNATQASATAIYIDLIDALGATQTAVLDTLDLSTSTVKGYIRLQVASDPTKWVLFSLASRAAPTGYRNLTVSVVAVSGANPFTNNDLLTLTFTPKGDKGDTGLTGTSIAWTQLATQTISGTPTTVTFTGISSSYCDLQIVLDSFGYSGVSTIRMSLSADGVTYGSAADLTSTTAILTGLIPLDGYRQSRGMAIPALLNSSGGNGTLTGSAGTPLFWRCDGGVSAIRFTCVSGTFVSGTVTIFGK